MLTSSLLDAFKIVILHSDSTTSILNRKPISKEILFTYLTAMNVPVTSNFTKNTLVEQVIEYWNSTEHRRHPEISQHTHQHQEAYMHHSAESLLRKSEDFPANVMAKNFSSWFFKNLNENSIREHDFWSDCTCVIRMIDSQGDVKEDSTISSGLVLNLLFSVKTQFNFFFNPNLSYQGTRGK